jgi:nitric oxide reductase NorE protein
VGIWVFIFMDMWWFSIMFGVVVWTRGQHHALFEQGRHTLTLWAGTLNTVLLLTASLFVVQGLQAIRRNKPELSRRMFGLAMLCALGFLINKGFEWGRLLDHHHHPGSNDFYTYFFIITGIHAVHLLLGTAGLGYMRRVTRRPNIGRTEMRNLEVVACYWHLVDLLWVVIFAVFYLMR